jgi:methionyl-tRNA formyltransferase
MINIAFASSNEFTLPILKKLIESGDKYCVKLVITQPFPTNGRKVKNTIYDYAKENNISIWQPENINKELGSNLIGIDLVVTASFGQFITQSTIKTVKYGFINWHPSKLPLYRGATPIQSALYNGDKLTAVSWISMKNEMDAGDVFLQQDVVIEDEDNFITLANKVGIIGGLTVDIAIQNCIHKIYGIQNDAKATLCKKIEKEDKLVDPKQLTATQIYNHFRAYIAFPGTFIYNEYFEQIVKVRACKVVETNEIDGEFNPATHILCKENSILYLSEIILETGKSINFKGYQFVKTQAI